jgi:hypothetical protein
LGLRNRLSKSELIQDPAVFVELLNNHRVEIQRLDMVGPKIAMVTHVPRESFVDENPTTNVVISLYTTSSARLRLLDAMEMVKDSGAEIYYTDT